MKLFATAYSPQGQMTSWAIGENGRMIGSVKRLPNGAFLAEVHGHEAAGSSQEEAAARAMSISQGGHGFGFAPPTYQNRISLRSQGGDIYCLYIDNEPAGEVRREHDGFIAVIGDRRRIAGDPMAAAHLAAVTA